MGPRHRDERVSNVESYSYPSRIMIRATPKEFAMLFKNVPKPYSYAVPVTRMQTMNRSPTTMMAT